jgi:hypothetical protein
MVHPIVASLRTNFGRDAIERTGHVHAPAESANACGPPGLTATHLGHALGS